MTSGARRPVSDLPSDLSRLLAEREARAYAPEGGPKPIARVRSARAALRDGLLLAVILLATLWPLWRLLVSPTPAASGAAPCAAWGGSPPAGHTSQPCPPRSPAP